MLQKDAAYFHIEAPTVWYTSDISQVKGKHQGVINHPDTVFLHDRADM